MFDMEYNMRTIFLKRFLSRCFYVNTVALGLAAIKELATDFSLQADKVPDEETYQTARDVFIAMGANLKDHPLQLISQTYTKANVHANLITGAYCLGYFRRAYDEFQRANHSNLSRQEFERAMYAHESVHAMERHDLLNSYISLICALTMTRVVCSFQLHFAVVCAISSVSYFSTSRYVSRRLEYRADRLAATTIPGVRNNLITILSTPDHHNRYLFGLFDGHPSKFERRKALEEFNSLEETATGPENN